MRLWPALIALMLFSVSCTNTAEKKEAFEIVCTTGMLADMVSELTSGIDSIEVRALMGPGTDPHLFKASQGDVMALSRADLIVYNGLHLEGKMNSIFEKMGTEKVYAAAEALAPEQLINATEYEQAYDPHVWFDLSLWAKVCVAMTQHLQKVLPNHTEQLSINAKLYSEKLLNHHSTAITLFRQIPEKQRVLVTAHDAFKYFGEAYSVEVRGLQGISTTAEFGLRDVSDLADFIYERQIPAIFVESSVAPKSIEAVQEAVARKGGQVLIGGELFSDALGPADTEANNFLGMFDYNVKTIASALR